MDGSSHSPPVKTHDHNLERTEPAGPGRERLLSLDVFRGFLIAYMVVAFGVGDSSQRYSQMVHSGWGGFTFHDLFFPWFLLAVGTAMSFALVPRALERGLGATLPRIARRVVVLFAIGVAINAVIQQFPHPAELRIMGALQLIALSYFGVSIAAYVLPRRVQFFLPVIFLGAFWALMTRVPVSGHGAGVLTPEGNMAGAIDRAVLGAPRLHAGGPYDPEGLLMLLPAMAIVLVGLEAGRRIKERPGRATAWKLFAGGIVLTAAGYLWSFDFPFIKWLWTGSFVLVATGTGLSALGALNGLVDVAGRRRWAWLLDVPGRNALFSYVSWLALPALLSIPRIRSGGGSITLYRWFHETLVAWWAAPIIGGRNASVLFGFLVLVLWWLLLHRMYRRGIFIRA